MVVTRSERHEKIGDNLMVRKVGENAKKYYKARGN